jgi:FlaG/FlaF family flagellin (archaellin)
MDHEMYVHVDYEWIQSGDEVLIDYTIYNRGNVPLEDVTVEFGVDTENNNDYNGLYDIQKWTNTIDLNNYDSHRVRNFRIPLYGETAYGVGLVSIGMDNPPDDENSW